MFGPSLALLPPLDDFALTCLVSTLAEDINHSGDGGLHAELLRNRALQIVDIANQEAALYAWHPLNGSTLQAVNDTKPVSAALPNSFKVDLKDGQASFENEGYWGALVRSSSFPFLRLLTTLLLPPL